MKRPITFPLIGLILGILVYEFIKIDFSFCLIFSISIYFIYKIYKHQTFLLLIFCIAGFFLSNFNYHEINLDKSSMTIEVLDAMYYEDSNTYIVRTHNIEGENTKIKALFYSDIEYTIGDVLNLKASISPISSISNYRTFNRKRYYKTKKIYSIIRSNSEKFAYNSPSIKNQIFNSVRNRYETELNDRSANFMKSMVLGIRNEDELKDEFNEMGLAHILAISGLHINIILSLLDRLGLYLGIKKKYYGIFNIILLLLYGNLISFPVSMIRALIMYINRFMAVQRLKIIDDLTFILVAIFISLLINPFNIYSTSFYLSTASIFSIQIINSKIKRIFSKIPDFLQIYLALQVGTLPLVIYYFNSVSLINLLSNIVFVPIMTLNLILGIILIIFNFPILSFLIDGAFEFISSSIYLLEKLIDMSKITFHSPSIFLIILYYFALFLILNYRFIIYRISKNKKNLFILLPFIIAISKSIIPLSLVNFIDVGQGDSILVRMDEANLLIDTGGNFLNSEQAEKEFISYLKKNGVQYINYVFISHADFDHMGNLNALIDQIKIGEVIGAVDSANREELAELSGKNFALDLIVNEKLEANKNDSSKVYLLNINNLNILLTGDIELNEDKISIDKKIDFLKVSHHGSKHSTNDDFLDRHEIDKAIISVGKNNRYGHPSEEVLSRLAKRGIDILRTDRDGNIEIRIRPYGYYIDYYNKKYTILDFFSKLIFY